MALIFRSMLEVNDEDFAGSALGLFRDWLRWKLRIPELEVPDDGEVVHLGHGRELRARSGVDEAFSGFRGSLFEPRASEQLRTTFTAMAHAGQAWSWIDLERWTDDPFEGSWVPMAPGIVGNVVRHTQCRRGA